MKWLKVLVLIIFVFLLSGCTVNYNIELDQDGMTEKSIFTLDGSKESEKRVNDLYKTPLVAYYDMDVNKSFYYKAEKSKKDNNNILTYTYRFKNTQLRSSPLVEGCYYKRNVMIDDDYIVLQTDERVTCLFEDGYQLVDELKINIRTRLNVVEQNADYHDGNTYTWVINKNNYTNKPIYFKVEKMEEKTGTSNFGIGEWLVVIGVVAGISFIVYRILMLKRKKANKI